MGEHPDLRTTYLGMALRSPIVASAGPLTGEVDSAKQLEAAGAGALVMPSLFEEEILHEEMQLAGVLEAGTEHFAEALRYFPAVRDYPSIADRYIDTVAALKQALDIPVIASLNASSRGGWVRYAALLEDAGADAIELNVYRVAADPSRSATDVEAADLALVGDVRAALGIPLAVKVSPYYSAFAHFALRAVEAGASGLVLFNRFYQPDLDLDALEVVPRLDLSYGFELRLPLRWIAILRPLLGARASLAATSGIETGRDVAKALLVGADVAMMTSAVLRHGPQQIEVAERELVVWAVEHEYESVAQLRGSVSYAATDDPAAFERSNYIRTLHSWTGP